MAASSMAMCRNGPKDQALVASRGPWDNDLAEQWQRQLAGYTYSRPDDRQLVDWVVEGVSLSNNPSSDFQTQGTMYAFSTVRPPDPDTGTLSLRSIRKDLLDAIIFMLITVPGVVLVTQSLSTRAVAVGFVLFGLVTCGIFLPSFSLQLFDSPLYLALFVVAAVWALLGFFRLFRTSSASRSDDGGSPPPGTDDGPDFKPASPSPTDSPLPPEVPKIREPSIARSSGASSDSSVQSPRLGAIAAASSAAAGTLVRDPDPKPKSESDRAGVFASGGLFSWGTRPLEAPSYSGPPVQPLPKDPPEPAVAQSEVPTGMFASGGLFAWGNRGGQGNG